MRWRSKAHCNSVQGMTIHTIYHLFSIADIYDISILWRFKRACNWNFTFSWQAWGSGLINYLIHTSEQYRNTRLFMRAYSYSTQLYVVWLPSSAMYWSIGSWSLLFHGSFWSGCCFPLLTIPDIRCRDGMQSDTRERSWRHFSFSLLLSSSSLWASCFIHKSSDGKWCLVCEPGGQSNRSPPRRTFISWANLACFLVASMILMLACIILGLICLRNFGKGLSPYRTFFSSAILENMVLILSQCMQTPFWSHWTFLLRSSRMTSITMLTLKQSTTKLSTSFKATTRSWSTTSAMWAWRWARLIINRIQIWDTIYPLFIRLSLPVNVNANLCT